MGRGKAPRCGYRPCDNAARKHGFCDFHAPAEPPPAPSAEGLREPRHCGFCQSALCECPPDDSDIPSEIADEMFRAASASGRISYKWMLSIYRRGRAHSLRAPAPVGDHESATYEAIGRYAVQSARWVRHEHEHYAAVPVAFGANLESMGMRFAALSKAASSPRMAPPSPETAGDETLDGFAKHYPEAFAIVSKYAPGEMGLANHLAERFAAIEADARAALATARAERDRWKQRVDDWRADHESGALCHDLREMRPDTPLCDRCRGWGRITYASTATWRGGIGGQAFTPGVCDKCWGSGEAHNPWPSHRLAIEAAQAHAEGVRAGLRQAAQMVRSFLNPHGYLDTDGEALAQSLDAASSPTTPEEP